MLSYRQTSRFLCTLPWFSHVHNVNHLVYYLCSIHLIITFLLFPRMSVIMAYVTAVKLAIITNTRGNDKNTIGLIISELNKA